MTDLTVYAISARLSSSSKSFAFRDDLLLLRAFRA
jgi:hypothetical protein